MEEEGFELSKEEKAFFLKAIWESLQEPPWTKDDLIDFGKAIFDKVSLKKMDDATFQKVFPFLESITNSLTEKIRTNAVKDVKEKSEPEKEISA